MTDPMQGSQEGPSEEEVQQYLEQLRSADAAEIIAQAFNMLATGAQVKMGRPDARVLIDALAGVVDNTSQQLPQQVGDQMRESVGQLQTAQVQAEQEDAGHGASGGEGEGGQGTAGAEQQPDQGGEGTQSGQRMTDRLWVPGKQPGGGG